MTSKSAFTEEEIQKEHARRRRGSPDYGTRRLLQCLHCGNEFDPAQGGNAAAPLCDHCLHSGD